MDKKNMTYELRIKAIIDEAQRNLGTFEKQLKTTWENGLPPKHMSKSLEGIRARLTSLQEIAKKGVVNSSDLAMAERVAGYVYNISDDFVTDNNFVEGSGHYYAAGTNVYYTASGWNCLGGSASPTATVEEVKSYLGI